MIRGERGKRFKTSEKKRCLSGQVLKRGESLDDCCNQHGMIMENERDGETLLTFSKPEGGGCRIGGGDVLERGH